MTSTERISPKTPTAGVSPAETSSTDTVPEEISSSADFPQIPESSEKTDNPPGTAHAHEYTIPVYEVIRHEAETQTVFHPEEIETVFHPEETRTIHIEESGHEEEIPVYGWVTVCDGCGQTVSGSYLDHWCDGWGSYHSEWLQIGTEECYVIDIPAHDETVLMAEAWEENIIVQNAWTEVVIIHEAWEESVLTAYRCECGAVLLVQWD